MNLPAIQTPAKPIKLYRFFQATVTGSSCFFRCWVCRSSSSTSILPPVQKTPEFLEMNPSGKFP